MTNRLYLLIDEKRYYALVKIGFTSDLKARFFSYGTCNPEIECLDTIAIQQRTNREVEKKFHEELEKMGYSRARAKIITLKKSEWFKIPYNDPFLTEIRAKGFGAFQNGKKRKSLGYARD